MIAQKSVEKAHQHWLAESVGVFATTDRVVHVRGDDARSWLNGQVSHDVAKLSGDSAQYAMALTVKGRVVSDLWALEDPPGMAIVLPAARIERALERFEQYIIMEDVELAADPELVVITVQGPRASELVDAPPAGLRRYPCARLATSGFDVWVPKAQAAELLQSLGARASALGGGVVDEAGWAEAHVALGVPRIEHDFGDDTYPQEAGVGARALSFGKGCYLGQEVVYMLHNRGQLARRLVQLEAPGGATLAVGATVVDADGKRLGEVTSSAAPRDNAPTLGLAFVKRALSEPDQTVWVAGSPCRVKRVIGA
jgi:folate-binding protein YgfZ